MKLVHDDIIYNLQNKGGITNYWKNLKPFLQGKANLINVNGHSKKERKLPFGILRYMKSNTEFKTNFIFHEDLIFDILKIINQKGIINIGGKSQTIYQFAKKYKKNVKKKISKGELPSKIYMNLEKVNNLLKK